MPSAYDPVIQRKPRTALRRAGDLATVLSQCPARECAQQIEYDCQIEMIGICFEVQPPRTQQFPNNRLPDLASIAQTRVRYLTL